MLVIKHGRHLLLEKKLDAFVANSTALGTVKTEATDLESGESDSRVGGGLIHIITGPNNSGKSVYLKQVGIIAYLAHTGSFVPASEAVIGVCDAILTRVKGIEFVHHSTRAG
jgi:DNA mismatch repair ATPase MutS